MQGAREDVIVVGAGAIGLAAALALRAQGRQVRVIDRGRVGGATSHGNCGTITPGSAWCAVAGAALDARSACAAVRAYAPGPCIVALAAAVRGALQRA